MTNSRPFGRCQGCRRDAPSSILEPIMSVLDFELHDLCPACVDNHAEPVLSVIRTTNATGWKTLPAEIRAAVRVYDTDEYVTVGQWARRMSRRQLVPAKPPEPELEPEDELRLDAMKSILDKIKKTNAPEQRPIRRGFFEMIMSFFMIWKTA